MGTFRIKRTIGWRGEVYTPGLQEIPDELEVLLGGSQQNVNSNPPPASITIDESIPAIALINRATKASELTVLPGIGPASAALIMAAKGESTIVDLEELQQLVPELLEPRFSIDWKILSTWEPE